MVFTAINKTLDLQQQSHSSCTLTQSRLPLAMNANDVHMDSTRTSPLALSLFISPITASQHTHTHALPPALSLVVGDMLQYDMSSMGTMAGPNDGFMSQLHDMVGFDASHLDLNGNPMMNSQPSYAMQQQLQPPMSMPMSESDANDLAAKNRNRGNYRCSKVRLLIQTWTSACI